jgi:hypothetical protein
VLPSWALSGYPDDVGVIVADELPADPLDALRELARTEVELDELRRQQVAAARAAGATWEQVGEALGISRQSAWEHYAARTRAELAANAVANTDLSEEDAVDLAVEDVRAVRRGRRAG